VLDSVFDPERQRVVGLVVRERLLGAVPGPTSEVPADRIAAAVPGREAFVLDGAGEEQEPTEPRQRRLAPAVRAAGTGAAGAARAAGTGAAGAVRRIAPAGPWLTAQARAAVPILRSVAAAIAAWAVGFAAWIVAASRALASEGRRAAVELRRRWSPP
jgi:hypothetical protein